jgi:hypothetical protein
MITPIYQGKAQSDLDMAGFDLLNWSGGGGGGGSTDPYTVVATDIGMVNDGVTDNTAALQTWLNSVGTAKVNSTLLVPDGVYIFSGPLQDTSRQNAQILLPSMGVNDTRFTITIKGYHALCDSPWNTATISGTHPSKQPKGPVFKSTLATGSGTQPSFISGFGPHDVYAFDVNFICLCFENIIFRTVPNPVISCLNLSLITNIQFKGDVMVIAGDSLDYADWVQPTTVTSYGVILPATGCTILHQINHLTCWNFYTGIRMGELAAVRNLFCFACIWSMEIPAALDPILIDRFWEGQSKYGINVSGTQCVFKILQWDIEQAASAQWNTRVADVADHTNHAKADVTWTAIDIAGAPAGFIMDGGANIIAHQCGDPTVYIGTDARLVAITGGTKLQVRNATTGVWVDADSWTNP